jgi:hypothetical protein
MQLHRANEAFVERFRDKFPDQKPLYPVAGRDPKETWNGARIQWPVSEDMPADRKESKQRTRPRNNKYREAERRFLADYVNGLEKNTGR